jgi:hypothetical protein
MYLLYEINSILQASCDTTAFIEMSIAFSVMQQLLFSFQNGKYFLSN